MKNFLKRIELQGFKSFATRTILEFPERVTAVVGPNGSGKSNVIDALRWVLGEREAKQLRGDTLDTLIFAGTPKKAAVSLAKVTLYFNNESRVFPMDAEEVMLTRKIDRSGNSQFFLHDEEIRLRDLIPMLARARLGSRGLMMVGQGQSDVFVKSSPQDRRVMVEEVLGLREFRLKKNQSERQLLSSETNLEKVHAMLEELGPHLRFLRRQKNRFEKRAEIETTLLGLENGYFAYKWNELKRQMAELSSPAGTLEDEIKKKEHEVQILQKQLDEMYRKSSDTSETKRIREEISERIRARSEAERALARIEAKIEFSVAVPSKTAISTVEIEATVKDIVSELKEVLVWDDISRIRETLTRWRTKLQKFTGDEKKTSDGSFEEEKTQAKKAIAVIDAAICDLEKREETCSIEQQKINQELRSHIEKLEAKKNELRALTEQVRTYAFEKEKLELRLAELRREWQGLGRALHELDTLSADAPLPEEDAERRMLRLRTEIAAIGEIDTNLIQEADESEKRYAFLHKELEDTKKAIADLKVLIRDLERRIHEDFKKAFRQINEEFNKYFRLMFGGGRAHMKLEKYEPPTLKEGEASIVTDGEVHMPIVGEEKRDPELTAGIEIELGLPRKKITSLEMLSGGEKSLVSLAALFALIAVSPPPFLVLDEIDAPLDEENARRFSELIKEFAQKTQFVIVTHNRATMEAADVLYGVTMGDDGVSKVLSLKFEG
ncbi:MAG: AAA family ATPase [Patescibacteria group bacterium]